MKNLIALSLIVMILSTGCSPNPTEPDVTIPENYSVTFEMKLTTSSVEFKDAQEIDFSYRINSNSIGYYSGPGYGGGGMRKLYPIKPGEEKENKVQIITFTTTTGNDYKYEADNREQEGDVLTITYYKNGVEMKQVSDNGNGGKIILEGTF